MALAHIDVIRDVVTKSRQMLEERGLTDAYKDSTGRTLAEIEHAVGRIESRLKGGNADWNEHDCEAYWSFLDKKIDYLKDLAAEIDRDYESDKVR